MHRPMLWPHNGPAQAKASMFWAKCGSPQTCMFLPSNKPFQRAGKGYSTVICIRATIAHPLHLAHDSLHVRDVVSGVLKRKFLHAESMLKSTCELVASGDPSIFAHDLKAKLLRHALLRCPSVCIQPPMACVSHLKVTTRQVWPIHFKGGLQMILSMDP